MSIESHAAELQRKHDALEKALHEEELHAARDDMRISDLKKQKLRIKQELSTLSAAAQ